MEATSSINQSQRRTRLRRYYCLHIYSCIVSRSTYKKTLLREKIKHVNRFDLLIQIEFLHIYSCIVSRSTYKKTLLRETIKHVNRFDILIKIECRGKTQLCPFNDIIKLGCRVKLPSVVSITPYSSLAPKARIRKIIMQGNEQDIGWLPLYGIY